MRHAMIMAGGSGTRLWPVSRDGQPKQLVRFMHREGSDEPVSLLELSAARLEGVVPPEQRYICTGERYRDEILRTVPGFTDDRILGEPAPRDTVNAVGFTAAVLSKIDGPDAVFAVLTADHLIEPDDVFAKAVKAGFELVEADPSRLVTFGITPDHPATGFGYVERGDAIAGANAGFAVKRFVEKPDLERATAYVNSGNFLWNAGMFVFHAGTFMEMLRKHKPDSHAGLVKIAEAWGTSSQRKVLDEVYPTLPKVSVDYAVMEPASEDPEVSICGVDMDVSWLDVGSWPSYAETIEADEHGNRFTGGHAAAHDSRNCVIVNHAESGDHTVALVGCEDLIVIRTDRATLVMPRDRAQDIKALHATLPNDVK